MPLLWGLVAPPTLVELGTMLALGKVLSGLISGVPGYIYIPDCVIHKLEYLTQPSEEEMRRAQAEQTQQQQQQQQQPGQRPPKKGEKVPQVIKVATIQRGQAYTLPFFSELAVLANTLFLLLAIAPLRALWSLCVLTSTLPETDGVSLSPSLFYSPADVLTVLLLVVSVGVLFWMQRSCYSFQDNVGQAGLFVGLAASVAAYAVVMTEEVPVLNFGLKASYTAYVTHDAVSGSLLRFLMPPCYLLLGFLCAGCVCITYGCTSAVWRLVRCHYQLQDRYAQSLAALEEKRAYYLVNYKMAKANAQPLPEKLDFSAGDFVRSCLWAVLSYVTLLCPLLVAATFVLDLRIQNLYFWRQMICVVGCSSRVVLLRTYLQTFLLRDSEEATRLQGESKKWAEAMFRVSSRAMLLLLRASLVLLAPATTMIAIVISANRLATKQEVWFPTAIGDRLGNVVPHSLMAYEFRAPEDIPPNDFWRQAASLLMFWLAASESLFIIGFAAYRWFIKMRENTRR